MSSGKQAYTADRSVAFIHALMHWDRPHFIKCWSSILNVMDPSLELSTGEISEKLGRGRHTTRTATLYHFADGYLVDTPGFSSLDMEQVESIDKEELADCFREFEPYIGKCRFIGCAHYREPNCAVREAVEVGEISESRYTSYVTMYEAVKDKKEWEK